MTVDIAISRIRDEIYRQGGYADGAGAGSPSTRLVGSIFHRVFAGLVGPDAQRNLEAALADAEPGGNGWAAAIADHAYRHHLGAALHSNRAALEGQGPQVVSLWAAVEALSGWLAGLCGVLADRDQSSPQAAAHKLILEFVSTEERLCCEIRRPGWSDAVRLSGAADAVVRIPGRPVWCIVELKLGRTAPESDLAQACLYHHVLKQGDANSATAEGRSLAIVSFLPGIHERLLEERELAAAQEALENLAGRLAGVDSDVAKTTLADANESQPTDTRPSERGTVAEPATPDQRAQARQIVALYEEFGLSVELDGEPIAGPTFIRFRLRPGRRVTVRQLEQRTPELQLRLGLDSPPIVQTDRDVVTIDVRRPDRQTVLFSDVEQLLPPADESAGSARVPVGVDLGGKLLCADLAEPQNCHLLVAGTTGSGKSEWLRTALAGLIARNTPATLRLVLIDPKRNAFTDLKDSPFLLRPIVFPDSEDVVEVFDGLVEEMESRYRLMEGADSIAAYMRRTGERVPRIVCVCDEYADLISRDAKQRKAIEQRIFRMGSKARAAGIHLILATQQPSREIVKGALDSNLPTRVSLQTEKSIESRMMLGQTGAEHLLGRGDLLFKDIGQPQRLQAPYLPESERHALFAAKKGQPLTPRVPGPRTRPAR